jgi:hypothetical protein
MNPGIMKQKKKSELYYVTLMMMTVGIQILYLFAWLFGIVEHNCVLLVPRQFDVEVLEELVTIYTYTIKLTNSFNRYIGVW